MSRVSTNAPQLSRRYADREKRWSAALVRAMRRAVIAVEIRAVDLLTGSGGPGSYPVPVRTGFLRRSTGSRVVATTGIVFNTAGYAHAIHSGVIAVGYRGQGRKHVDARPFLNDALAQANPGAIIRAAMAAAL